MTKFMGGGVLISLLVISLFLNTSCAVIFNGNKELVNIYTTEKDAKILVDGKPCGYGSCSVELKRIKSHKVFIEKNEYESKEIKIKSKILWGWVVFDLLLNWFAFLTDIPTGALCGFDQTCINVPFERERTKQ